MGRFLAIVFILFAAVACGDDGDGDNPANNGNNGNNGPANNGNNGNNGPANNGNNGNNGPGNNGNNGNNGPANNGEPLRRATVAHSFGEYTLEPFEEVQPCVAWTLGNEETLYVETVTLATEGGFHHSNWFVVPEANYDGPDGFFDCDERGFEEVASAVAGTVLFAQSTQALAEQQRLGDGIVIKIPPRHKVVSSLHMINFAPRETATELRMGLEIIHPADVKTVVTPFRLTYTALDIPPRSEARFSGECDFKSYQEEALPDVPWNFKLYWVLPHYHNLGNYFELEVFGGEMDGTMVYQLDGFNADANGRGYSPPLEIAQGNGFRFTCGYRNPRDESVGWGIGDQEMCVMLGFADSPLLYDATVRADTVVVGNEGNIQRSEGPCELIGIPKNAKQTPPTEAEKARPLYVPVSDLPADQVSPQIECVDSDPDAAPDTDATLTAVRDNVLLPGCSYSSCHGSGTAGGLAFDVDDLHGTLLGHEVTGPTEMPLIDPGNPDGSWLYRKLAYCEPEGKDGATVAHMPINSPILIEDELVALVREWIAAGALDN